VEVHGFNKNSMAYVDVGAVERIGFLTLAYQPSAGRLWWVTLPETVFTQSRKVPGDELRFCLYVRDGKGALFLGDALTPLFKIDRVEFPGNHLVLRVRNLPTGGTVRFRGLVLRRLPPEAAMDRRPGTMPASSPASR
jgi:hypothetical protein